jgi:hypothetical protein
VMAFPNTFTKSQAKKQGYQDAIYDSYTQYLGRMADETAAMKGVPLRSKEWYYHRGRKDMFCAAAESMRKRIR